MIEQARKYCARYQILMNNKLEKSVERSFIAHAQNAIKSCDNFGELVTKLGDKMRDKKIGTWSIGANTNTTSSNFVINISFNKLIKVKFGELILAGYLRDN